MLTDIKIKDFDISFQKIPFRTPLKFGAVVMNEATYCNCKVEVENRKGVGASGLGSMSLADMWAFPSKVVEHKEREEAMKEIALEYAQSVKELSKFSHPVDIFWELEERLKEMTKEVSMSRAFKEEVPFLAALVSASAIDASLHDAFGKVNKISSYDGYGKEFMQHDLGYYLGERFKNKYISDYLRKSFLPELPVFHLVGGLDKLRKEEVNESDPKDGIPNSLDEWIEKEGLTHLKVKLKGNDLEWDLERIFQVARVAMESQRKIGKDELYFSIDTNEQCENPDYMIDLLERIKENDEKLFKEILYIEQPTERDLSKHRFDMRKLSSLKPVIIDESLATLEDFELAKELGWSGIALKTCKCHSSSLLFVCKAEEEKIPYAVQDLSLYGLSLVHSVGFAARINTINGVEANGCQYCKKDVFLEEKRVHPEIMFRKDGKLRSSSLKGDGLGFQREDI